MHIFSLILQQVELQLSLKLTNIIFEAGSKNNLSLSMNTIQIFSKSRSHGPELEGRDLRTVWAGPLSPVGPWRHPWVGTAQTLLQ